MKVTQQLRALGYYSFLFGIEEILRISLLQSVILQYYTDVRLNMNYHLETREVTTVVTLSDCSYLRKLRLQTNVLANEHGEY